MDLTGWLEKLTVGDAGTTGSITALGTASSWRQVPVQYAHYSCAGPSIESPTRSSCPSMSAGRLLGALVFTAASSEEPLLIHASA
jgi:hypothetical protein